jgi:very-short-patch-repair endonuclease
MFDYILKTEHNGIKPLCKCGCGSEVIFKKDLVKFGEFVRGHNSRIEGYWGNLKDPKKAEKISKTRKEKFATDEYNHIREATKNRDNVALGKSISKRMKGVAKPKPKGFGEGRIHSQETKDKMRDTAIENILKTGRVKVSNLEYRFESILILEGIKYIHSYYIKDINFNKIYDFYLPEYNILIEVDGDFWHCNPNTKFALPECKSQEINIINDKLKNEWAYNNGYKLLRFWETDINNNILEVKRILLENLK